MGTFLYSIRRLLLLLSTLPLLLLILVVIDILFQTDLITSGIGAFIGNFSARGLASFVCLLLVAIVISVGIIGLLVWRKRC